MGCEQSAGGEHQLLKKDLQNDAAKHTTLNCAGSTAALQRTQFANVNVHKAAKDGNVAAFRYVIESEVERLAEPDEASSSFQTTGAYCCILLGRTWTYHFTTLRWRGTCSSVTCSLKPALICMLKTRQVEPAFTTQHTHD